MEGFSQGNDINDLGFKRSLCALWRQEWTQGDHPERSIPEEFLTLPDRIHHTLVSISIIALMDFQICHLELYCKLLVVNSLHITSVQHCWHIAVIY